MGFPFLSIGQERMPKSVDHEGGCVEIRGFFRSGGCWTFRRTAGMSRSPGRAARRSSDLHRPNCGQTGLRRNRLSVPLRATSQRWMDRQQEGDASSCIAAHTLRYMALRLNTNFCEPNRSKSSENPSSPLPQKYSASRLTPNQRHNSPLILSTRGVSRSSRTLGWDAVDAAASGARSVRRAVSVSDRRRARRTALMRTAKPCGPGTRCWCQVGGGEVDPTGS